ncbi:hypothetical protein [Taibaiella chishuiensis]|nr:hypothetical protein [Taibaiella chishuiensis]
MTFDLLCMCVGLLLVPFVYFAFPRLFFTKSMERPCWIVAGLIAFAGLLAVLHNGLFPGPCFPLFLFCPLFALFVLRIGCYLFRKRYRRNPVIPEVRATSYYDEWDKDRVFLFLYLMIIVLGPTSIFFYMYPSFAVAAR